MDLRRLGDVEDAEVVRDAVRRFRRRTLVVSVWILVVVLGVGVIALRLTQVRSSDFRIQVLVTEPLNQAMPVYEVGGAEFVEPVTIQLTRVTRISGDRLAIVLDYAPARQQGRRVQVYPPPARDGFGCSQEFQDPLSWPPCDALFQQYSLGCTVICQTWLTVPLPLEREIPIDVRVPGAGPPVRLRLNLDDAKVPSLGGEG
jgi:hypothetical protein